jgi:hypothetical protein
MRNAKLVQIGSQKIILVSALWLIKEPTITIGVILGEKGFLMRERVEISADSTFE